MSTASKSAPFRSAAGRKRKPVARLPESAAFTRCDGREFVLLPVDDLNEWLEDRKCPAKPTPRQGCGAG